MQTPLNASATTAGTLISGFTFQVPPYQREYSWEVDKEVSEFWSDLQKSLKSESYFLGLIILTDEGEERKHVVDGQQRILTLTLLAAAIYHEAKHSGRKALAERIQADFLKSIDYETDETHPRVALTDEIDNSTFQEILSNGEFGIDSAQKEGGEQSPISTRLLESFNYLRKELRKDLAQDPFKRLGQWTEFITNKLYFAVFIHPDEADAYRVFEVINTRGRELTTADLLKNYILSQTGPQHRDSRYKKWQGMARQFPHSGANSFVQFIRHVVTVQAGHILPKDLYDFLAQRTLYSSRRAPRPDELMDMLKGYLPLYMQMNDPTLDGPADLETLKIFNALNDLKVIAVRPILLAIFNTPDSLEGMKYVLKLVVRRMVAGGLGTGNVERRFGEAAKMVCDSKDWRLLERELKDLNPSRDDFVERISKKPYNKGTLAFIRKSIIAEDITPDTPGILHFIMPRQQIDWSGVTEEDASFWSGTLANTFIADLPRRPKEALDWIGFKQYILPQGVEGEWSEKLRELNEWNTPAMEKIGQELAEAAGNVWY